MAKRKKIEVDGMPVTQAALFEAAEAFRAEFKYYKGPDKLREAVRILRDNEMDVTIE